MPFPDPRALHYTTTMRQQREIPKKAMTIGARYRGPRLPQRAPGIICPRQLSCRRSFLSIRTFTNTRERKKASAVHTTKTHTTQADISKTHTQSRCRLSLFILLFSGLVFRLSSARFFCYFFSISLSLSRGFLFIIIIRQAFEHAALCVYFSQRVY